MRISTSLAALAAAAIFAPGSATASFYCEHTTTWDYICEASPQNGGEYYSWTSTGAAQLNPGNGGCPEVQDNPFCDVVCWPHSQPGGVTSIVKNAQGQLIESQTKNVCS